MELGVLKNTSAQSARMPMHKFMELDPWEVDELLEGVFPAQAHLEVILVEKTGDTYGRVE